MFFTCPKFGRLPNYETFNNLGSLCIKCTNAKYDNVVRFRKSLVSFAKRPNVRLNHVKENDLAHGQLFMEWVEKSLDINYKEAQRFMKVANELSNFPTLGNIGTEALYLISTLPEPDTRK